MKLTYKGISKGVFMVATGRFIENENVDVEFYRCDRNREKPKHYKRKVKFDKVAGDLYIKIENNKYFYYEFE